METCDGLIGVVWVLGSWGVGKLTSDFLKFFELLNSELQNSET